MAEHALFRREVLQARAPATVGAIRLATPLSHRVWAALGVCFAASLCVWLGVGHYTRRERVVGNLTPQAGLLTVSARVLGNLATVHATEGATVRAGDALATISTERSSAKLTKPGIAYVDKHSKELFGNGVGLEVDDD
ncbi:biotin/lipoyl-binding protein [Dyella sp. 2YAF14]|uniref:biotin/lipoyl-binding protein n=1 Tax=Dyella sp. 2YAF14 TaxID=3233025 RepID=UPI003F8DB8C8